MSRAPSPQGTTPAAAKARHSVSALLSSSDGPLFGDVHYPLSEQEVIDLVHDAITSGQYEPLAGQLDGYNNLGCPQNNSQEE